VRRRNAAASRRQAELFRSEPRQSTRREPPGVEPELRRARESGHSLRLAPRTREKRHPRVHLRRGRLDGGPRLPERSVLQICPDDESKLGREELVQELGPIDVFHGKRQPGRSARGGIGLS